jgi:hypothetical protein
VVKIATFAKPETVISNPMTTVQTLNDIGKMNDRTILAKPFGYPSQKQKSCKAETQANAICSTFAFAQPHPNIQP